MLPLALSIIIVNASRDINFPFNHLLLSLVLLWNSLYLMFGGLPLFSLTMNSATMLLLLITLVDILGFIY